MKNEVINEISKPQKPTSVVKAEFITDLTTLINNVPLPSFVIEPVLKDVYEQVRSVARQQYEQDKRQYEQAMQEYEAQAAKKK